MLTLFAFDWIFIPLVPQHISNALRLSGAEHISFIPSGMNIEISLPISAQRALEELQGTLCLLNYWAKGPGTRLFIRLLP